MVIDETRMRSATSWTVKNRALANDSVMWVPLVSGSEGSLGGASGPGVDARGGYDEGYEMSTGSSVSHVAGVADRRDLPITRHGLGPARTTQLAPSSRDRSVAALTASRIAARKPCASSTRKPAAVVPPGEVTAPGALRAVVAAREQGRRRRAGSAPRAHRDVAGSSTSTPASIIASATRNT